MSSAPAERRVRVKICGITRLEDAAAAVEAGADAIGLIFHPPSPRYVTAEAARSIVRSLPPFVAPVGVFVDAELYDIETICEEADIETVQLHGRESEDLIGCLAEHHRIIRAVRVSARSELESLRATAGASAWLLDAHVPGGLPGGTGQSFPWEWLEALHVETPIILAGGLTAENVAEGIRRAAPYGVDVSSSVESAPGVKDPRRMRAFVSAVRAAECP